MTTHLNTTIKRFSVGAGAPVDGDPRPQAAWLVDELREAGIDAQWQRITRADFDDQHDDWAPGDYVFTDRETAARWDAAKRACPVTGDPATDFRWVIRAVGAERAAGR